WLGFVLRRVLAQREGRFGLLAQRLAGLTQKVVERKRPIINGADQQTDTPARALFAGFPASPTFLANLEKLTHFFLSAGVSRAQLVELLGQEQAHATGLRVFENLVGLCSEQPFLDF